jgi:hypothetical protein
VGVEWNLDAGAIVVIAVTFWLASILMIEMLKRAEAGSGAREEHAPA